MSNDKQSSIEDKGWFGVISDAKKVIVLIGGILAGIYALIVNWDQLMQYFFPQPHEYVEFVLDSSSSMGEEFDQGRSKWESAKSVLLKTLTVFEPDNQKIVLRRFGGSCVQDNSTRLNVKLGKTNAEEIQNELDAIDLGGQATLLRALTEAIGDFEKEERFSSENLTNWIIVISGSGDECNNDSLQFKILRQRMSKLGIKPVFRLVGMKVGSGELVQLTNVAKALGGEIVPADNEAELQDAVESLEPGGDLTKNKAKEYYEKMNDSRALPLFEKNAEEGDVEAMVHAGYIFSDKNGPERNDSKAIHWFRMASDSGSAEAMYRLGAMYLDGQGVAANTDSAWSLWKKAESLGHEKAREKLGQLAGLPRAP